MKSKYDEDEDSGGSGFATGLFLGAVIGACAALLWAPKSGAEQRQEIKDFANLQKDNLKNQWDQTKEKAAEAINIAKDKVSAVVEQAKSSVDMYADKTKDKVDQLADNAKSTADKFNPDGDSVDFS